VTAQSFTVDLLRGAADQQGITMTSSEHNGHANHDHAAEAATEPHEEAVNGAANGATNETLTVAATVGVVAVGAALVEVALVPGIVLGVAAMLAPKYVPKLGSALQPMFRSSVRSIYKFGQKSREMMAEAKEQMHDIVAEVHAEGDKPKAAPTEAPRV
jgi:hypothetical protein